MLGKSLPRGLAAGVVVLGSPADLTAARTTGRRVCSVSLALFLILALGTPVAAFRTLGTTWRSNPRYHINPSFPDTELSGTAEQQVEILRAAASAWTTQSSANFEFVFADTSTRTGFNTTDGINNISWVDADGGAAVAATLVDGIGDRATGFDIVFFGSTGGVPNRWNGPRDPAPGTLDIAGVAVHEFGHALGLDHTSTRDATMFATVGQRALPARTLHEDDRDGVEFLYDVVAGQDLAPTVIFLEPAFGPPEGGGEAAIRGTNFSWKSDTTLFIDGSPVPEPDFQVESLGLIRVLRMPPHTEGFVDVTVETLEFGAGTLSRGYRYGPPPPAVFSVDPDVGPAAGGIRVTISGRSLTLDSEIAFGERSLEGVRVLDPQTLTGRVPAVPRNATVDVSLTHELGTSVLPRAFTYTTDTLRIGEGRGEPGLPGVRVPVLASSESDLNGVTFAVAYDPKSITIDEVTVRDTAAEAAMSALANIDNEEGLTTFEIVMRFDTGALCGDDEPPPSICAGEDVEVARIFAKLSETAEPGERIPLRLLRGSSSPGALTFTPVGAVSGRRPFAIDGRVTVGDQPVFLRGDTDSDDRLDITDPIFHLAALFLGGPGSTCPDAADSNDDGDADASDAVYSLNFLFIGGPPPPPPFPSPGLDPSDDGLGCEL